MYNVTTIITALQMKFVIRVERRQYWHSLSDARVFRMRVIIEIAACTCL